MLWTEKYRPKSIDDVIGNNKEKKEIQQWLDQWKKGNPQKPLLLVGSAGIGKTTLAHLIAEQFDESIELNASDKRSQDEIMKTVGESSSSMPLFSQFYKCIILDEVDGIHGTNDRGGVKAINEVIKKSKHPLILIANDFYSKRLTTIKTKCQVIKMKKIRSPSINKLFKKIAEEEGVKADPEVLKELSKKAGGDLRSALNSFQAISDENKTLEKEDIENISSKDDRSTIINAVTVVMKSKTPSNVKKALITEEDPNLIMEYIAENVPREYKKKKEIQKAYENLAKADLYLGRAQQSRNYGYWKYATDYMGVGVANSKDETYRKFTKITSPTVFSKMRKNKGKKNLRDKIAEKMSEKMHISNAVAISMFPYLKIMFENDELAWEISDFLEFNDEEIKLFRKKKIPKNVIRKMEKQKNQIRESKKEKYREKISEKIIKETGELAKNEVEDIESVIETQKEITKIEKKTQQNYKKEEDKFKIKNPKKTVENKKETKEKLVEDSKKDDKNKNEKSKQTSLFSF